MENAMMLTGIILVYLFLSYMVASYAQKKGGNFILWFVLSIVLSPLWGFIFALIAIKTNIDQHLHLHERKNKLRLLAFVGTPILVFLVVSGFSYYTRPDMYKNLCNHAIANYYEYEYDNGKYASMLGLNKSYQNSARKRAKAEILENCHYLDTIFIRGLND